MQWGSCQCCSSRQCNESSVNAMGLSVNVVAQDNAMNLLSVQWPELMQCVCYQCHGPSQCNESSADAMAQVTAMCLLSTP